MYSHITVDKLYTLCTLNVYVTYENSPPPSLVCHVRSYGTIQSYGTKPSLLFPSLSLWQALSDVLRLALDWQRRTTWLGGAEHMHTHKHTHRHTHAQRSVSDNIHTGLHTPPPPPTTHTIISRAQGTCDRARTDCSSDGWEVTIA